MKWRHWLIALSVTVLSVQQAWAVEDAFWLDVENNRTGSITRYLAQGVDPNIQSREKQPALLWAIQNEAWGVYDVLLAHRAIDVNIENSHGETPLMYLAIMGELDRAKQLVAKGAKINRLGWSPLHYAASKKQLKMAEWLLDQGAIVNAPASDGTTPLMMAARSGSSAMVNLLLEHGADPTVANTNKLTAADWAESNKQKRLANELRTISANYAQQRSNKQEKIILLRAHAADETVTEATSSEASGTSKYFDLKRFDEPVNP